MKKLCMCALGCVLVLGCGGPDETPAAGEDKAPNGERPPQPRIDAAVAESTSETVPPPVPAVIDEPSTANAGAARCSVGEPVALDAGGKRLRSLEVGFGPRGGLIAWPRDEQRVALVPLSADGTPSGEVAAVELPGARSVHAVTALGDSLVVSTHDLCPDKKYFFKCLHARALDTSGKPLGEVVTGVTKEWIRDEFHERIGPDEIWVLRSHMYVPPVIDSFTAGEGGALRIETVATLGGADELSWAKGFAVNGRHWYAVVESELSSRALVSSGSPPRPLNWLSADTRILAFEWHEGGLVLLFAPELAAGKIGRPRVALLGENGKLEAKPGKIGKGEPLPAPLAGRVEATVEKRGENLIFRRTDAAGDPIGGVVTIAPFPGGSRDDPRLSLGWTGERFVAVWSSFEDGRWKIYSAAISCGGAV
jgi:hypothetical protein